MTIKNLICHRFNKDGTKKLVSREYSSPEDASFFYIQYNQDSRIVTSTAANNAWKAQWYSDSFKEIFVVIYNGDHD